MGKLDHETFKERLRLNLELEALIKKLNCKDCSKGSKCLCYTYTFESIDDFGKEITCNAIKNKAVTYYLAEKV